MPAEKQWERGSRCQRRVEGKRAPWLAHLTRTCSDYGTLCKIKIVGIRDDRKRY
jgi:hypothetical protein